MNFFNENKIEKISDKNDSDKEKFLKINKHNSSDLVTKNINTNENNNLNEEVLNLRECIKGEKINKREFIKEFTIKSTIEEENKKNEKFEYIEENEKIINNEIPLFKKKKKEEDLLIKDIGNIIF